MRIFLCSKCVSYPLVPTRVAAAVLALALAPAGAVHAVEMADLSIEELANIQITSVSRQPERLAEAAASVYVITADDIRRSGAGSLPEILRQAPNLQVAQLNGYSYSVTARGLNGTTGSNPNKLLVLVDGRSVYSPLYSGVFWDAQDLVLEDIERIEVISGPGGTLWGVNAVNGVINISTRAARDTTGALLSVGGGARGADAAFRQGGVNGALAWRVYGKLFDQSATSLSSGGAVDDGWRQRRLGMRADWSGGADRVSVNGSLYRGTLDQPAPGAVVTGKKVVLGTIGSDGANLTGQWTHALDDGASLSLQAYADHTWRDVAPFFSESLDIVDLQLQHTLARQGAHQLVWGANYRVSADRITNSATIAFLPDHLHQHWTSLYAQDGIGLRDDVRLTSGVRFEHNDYTGMEVLPTLRLAWKLSPEHSLWSGLSRAVRAPSRLDVDVFVPAAPPYQLAGGSPVRSEVANVAELGYRGQPTRALSLSATLFHNRYRHMRTVELGPTFKYAVFDSKMRGQANGMEMWANLQAGRGWRLSAGWTALHERMTLEPGSISAASPLDTGRDPAHTLQLKSSMSFGGDKEFDIGLRKVAALVSVAVPAYTALDARFGWTVQPGVVLSLNGQNLNGGHAEYGPAATRSEIPRAIALRLVWQPRS